jgi:hypothetical protein
LWDKYNLDGIILYNIFEMLEYIIKSTIPLLPLLKTCSSIILLKKKKIKDLYKVISCDACKHA